MICCGPDFETGVSKCVNVRQLTVFGEDREAGRPEVTTGWERALGRLRGLYAIRRPDSGSTAVEEDGFAFL
jgi:hypothetical protein